MKIKNTLTSAIALLFFVFSLNQAHATTYSCNIGTSNLEVGIHERVTLEANRTYQIYVARIDSVGNASMTVPIKTNVTFVNNYTTLIDDFSSLKMNFLGKREYTYEQVSYPFFLAPGDQVQVWLNITLKKIGNYTFICNTAIQPILPFNYTGPISVNSGKFDVKLICKSPAHIQGGLPLTIMILGSVSAGLSILTLGYIYMKKRQAITHKISAIEKKPSRKEYMKNYMRDRRRKQREEKTRSD